MCGIIGYIGTPEAYKKTVECLTRLEYRGYDSAGIAVKNGSIVAIRKNVGYVNDVFPSDLPSLKGCAAIGHTRWATQGMVTKNNAHPHTDCTEKIAIVHNGIIDNYQSILDQLNGEHKIRSQCDSEIIAHLLEWTALPLPDAMFVTAEILKGQYAVVAMSADYDNLVAMRRGNPLVLGLANDCTYIASDPVAFPDEVKEIVFIGDDELVEIKPTSFTIYNLNNCQVIERKPVPFTPPIGAFNGLSATTYRMETEMLQQPTVIRNIANYDKDIYMKLALRILGAHKVILTGCGSSKHAALAGRFAMSDVARSLYDVCLASELEYFTKSIDQRTLIIALSQSGETADVIRAVQIVRAEGAKVISLINSPDSSLARISDYVLPLLCGAEISVASTKAFTSQMCSLFLLAFAMEYRFQEGKERLIALADTIETSLNENRQTLKYVADILKTKEHMYYIGRGVNYSLACEGALKMKEIAYIQAESFPSGELKHGALALIEKDTPVLGIVPNDNTYADTLVNLQEAKTRGAMIIGISDKKADVFDFWLPIPTVSPALFYPVVATVPIHLLAYHVSVNKGINPDRPRNLAKSVTVK